MINYDKQINYSLLKIGKIDNLSINISDLIPNKNYILPLPYSFLKIIDLNANFNINIDVLSTDVQALVFNVKEKISVLNIDVKGICKRKVNNGKFDNSEITSSILKPTDSYNRIPSNNLSIKNDVEIGKFQFDYNAKIIHYFFIESKEDLQKSIALCRKLPKIDNFIFASLGSQSSIIYKENFEINELDFLFERVENNIKIDIDIDSPLPHIFNFFRTSDLDKINFKINNFTFLSYLSKNYNSDFHINSNLESYIESTDLIREIMAKFLANGDLAISSDPKIEIIDENELISSSKISSEIHLPIFHTADVDKFYIKKKLRRKLIKDKYELKYDLEFMSFEEERDWENLQLIKPPFEKLYLEFISKYKENIDDFLFICGVYYSKKGKFQKLVNKNSTDGYSEEKEKITKIIQETQVLEWEFEYYSLINFEIYFE